MTRALIHAEALQITWKIGTFRGHTTKKCVKWVTLSHDGHWLLTVESDDAVHLYPWEMVAPLDDLIAIAKKRLFCTLKLEEKRKLLQ